jgi:hypothetical protein
MEFLAQNGRVVYLAGLALLVLGLILALAGKGLIGVIVGVIGFAALVAGLFGEERYGSSPPRR